MNREVSKQAIALFAAIFPKTFAGDGCDRLPLKIGIRKDLNNFAAEHLPGVSPSIIRDALKYYCRGINYLRNVQAGKPRLNLEGDIEGYVTEDEAKHAARRMAKNLRFMKRHKCEKEKGRGLQPKDF